MLRKLAPFIILITLLTNRTFMLPATADTPSDKQVSDAAAWYKANGKRNLDGIADPRLADLLKDVSLPEMTVPQLRQFKQAGILAQLDETGRSAIRAHLSQLSRLSDATGAEAAVLQLEVTPNVARGMATQQVEEIRHQAAEVLRSAILHPGLPELLSQHRGFEVYLHVYFKRYELASDLTCLRILAGLVDKFDGAGTIRPLLVYQEVACDAQSPLDSTEKAHITTCTKHNLDVALADPSLAANERNYLARQKDQLNGAAASGKLIGYPAPHIDLLWITGPAASNARDFSAFKGKVVVIDYWATWCVPCIGGFPRMRQLQEKYKNDPIVFLGITSLQGRMSFPYAKNGEPKPVGKLTEAQELELLPQWAQGMDMTWTVACTRQDCFNPDFGIRSIPHVAILDANGIVRYNGLSIGDRTLETKIEELIRK